MSCVTTPAAIWNNTSYYHIEIKQETLEGSGLFKIEGEVIWTVKFADDLVLLAKEEVMLQGTVDRLIETAKWYTVKLNM
jgi:hypothetical protein